MVFKLRKIWQKDFMKIEYNGCMLSLRWNLRAPRSGQKDRRYVASMNPIL